MSSENRKALQLQGFYYFKAQFECIEELCLSKKN